MDHPAEKVRVKAYEVWEREGQTGSPEDHWLRAEREIRSGQADDENAKGHSGATVVEASPGDAVAAANEVTDGENIAAPLAEDPPQSTPSSSGRKRSATGPSRRKTRSGKI
jgi:uncharacterized membrane protein